MGTNTAKYLSCSHKYEINKKNNIYIGLIQFLSLSTHKSNYVNFCRLKHAHFFFSIIFIALFYNDQSPYSKQLLYSAIQLHAHELTARMCGLLTMLVIKEAWCAPPTVTRSPVTSNSLRGRSTSGWHCACA